VSLRASELSEHYGEIEGRFDVVEAPDMATLVVPNGNAGRAFHRWFHLKEGYSCDLLDRVLTETGLVERERLTIIDPFVGGGTTLISAAEWALAAEGRSVRAVGIERNPFLAFLSRAKAEAFVAGELDVAARPQVKGGRVSLPALSTFRHDDYFDPVQRDELIRLRQAIAREPDGVARRLRLLALTTSVEPVSKLRRDGRTLRRWPDKPETLARHELDDRLARMNADLAGRTLVGPELVDLAVLDGDARDADRLLEASFAADLVVCSPPYPNNIDYTEVYKLEGWFLGAYADPDAFREQRKRTLRSHPSVLFDERPTRFDQQQQRALDHLVEPLIAAVPPGRYSKSRERVVEGYTYDMADTLRACRARAAPGGYMAVVIGNSLHGSGDESLLVAADLLIAGAAQVIGWSVDRIAVARRPARRGASEPRLRESLVLLRNDVAATP
jgi:hypothetical protein